MTTSEKNNFEVKGKAWIIGIDMGYGHQRTAYPLRNIAFGGRIISANNYKGIPGRDKKIWSSSKSFYEFVSRLRRIPVVGYVIFTVFVDAFQKIVRYYPKRDLSKPSFGSKNFFRLIKRGWGRDLVGGLENNPLPLITTFFAPALAAEFFDYPGEIYCVICDADVARGWASLEPKKSRIKYFVPNSWTRDRLRLYGVNPQNIIFTGYPLPKENIGSNKEIVKKDTAYRLLNLDPRGRYRKLYAPLIKEYLGELPRFKNHPLTIMFSIGGAGAQKEIGAAAVNSLKEKILSKELRVIISVGTHFEMKEYFEKHIKKIEVDGWAYILSGKTVGEYFEKFNRALRKTDILWTKPSELSFYAGLGIPIIIAPPLGSQEEFNKRWLLHVGAGAPQENSNHANQWIFDLIEGGDFAEMAMQGFVEIEKMGTYNIEKAIAV